MTPWPAHYRQTDSPGWENRCVSAIFPPCWIIIGAPMCPSLPDVGLKLEALKFWLPQPYVFQPPSPIRKRLGNPRAWRHLWPDRRLGVGYTGTSLGDMIINRRLFGGTACSNKQYHSAFKTIPKLMALWHQVCRITYHYIFGLGIGCAVGHWQAHGHSKWSHGRPTAASISVKIKAHQSHQHSTCC